MRMLTQLSLYSETSATPGKVQLLNHLGDDGLTCVNAARVSFGAKSEIWTKKDKKLLKYLIANKHTSVLEHNVLTFLFKVPLFVARQHMRHRTWSFNEISRRYTDKDLEFYSPLTFREQSKSNRQASIANSNFDPILDTTHGYTMDYNYRAAEAIRTHNADSLKLYTSMLNAGVCREQARIVLPQNLYTSYWGTVNLNNFIKFLNLRDHEGSQLEIQEVAKACKSLVTEIWPNIMELYNESKEIYAE